MGRIRHAASSASAFSAWSRQDIGPRTLPRGSSSMQCTPAAPREEVGCCKQQVSSPPFALAGTRDKTGIRRGVHPAHIAPPSLERALLVSSNNARAPTARAAQRATTRPPCRARRRRALQRVGRQHRVQPPLVLRLVPCRGVTSSACVNSSPMLWSPPGHHRRVRVQVFWSRFFMVGVPRVSIFSGIPPTAASPSHRGRE